MRMSHGKKPMKGSFFKKYFTVFSLVILISFSVIGMFLLFITAHFWKTSKLELLTENAQSIASLTEESLEHATARSDPGRSAVVLCNSISQISRAINADAFVCNASGDVIFCKEMFSSPDMSISDSSLCIFHNAVHVPETYLSEVPEGGLSEFSDLGGIYADKHVVSVMPIMYNGDIYGYSVVTAAVQTDLAPYVLKVFNMFMFAAAMALIMATIAIYILTDKFTKPLREMTEATMHYATGDFSYRVPIRGNNELTLLATNFNSMASDLAALENSRRSFVANVSHEFKTPMTTIGGFINGILDGTIPPDKQEHYLNIVSSEVKRLSRLVTTMLNISKIETGNVNLKYESFDVSKIIFNTFWGFEQLITKRNIDVKGLDLIEPTMLNADEDMITQVIYNLIDNAVKFSDDGGEISVSVEAAGSLVCFKIRNTGKGIPAEDIGRVFDRFYKVDKSRSTDVKSVGLGLFIVKSVIELHGGTITAASEVNKFTEFTVKLPK